MQKRKRVHIRRCEPLFNLVRLAGIEPTTPWFVAKYSIQLSYSRSGKTKVYHSKLVGRHGLEPWTKGL